VWVSQRPGGAEELILPHQQLKPLARNATVPFAIYVSVYGYEAAEFTLTIVSSTTLVDLQDGLAARVIERFSLSLSATDWGVVTGRSLSGLLSLFQIL
jgi:hypothetical protein